MKKSILILTALIPTLFVLVITGLIYLISPKSFWCVFFIVQGWGCHYLAQAGDAVGLSDMAWSVQQHAVSSYEKSDENIPGVEMRELTVDEVRTLAEMHMRKQNLDAALKDYDKIERIAREELKHDECDATKFRQGLATCLLNSGRIFAVQGRLAQSEACYKEATVEFRKLVSQNKSSEGIQKLLKVAEQELDEVEKKLRGQGKSQ